MVRHMANLFKRFLPIEAGASIPQAILDYFAGKWIEFAAVFVGGGGMGYLASITSWLKPWGPVAWGAAGIIAACAIGLAYAVISLIVAKKSAQYARANLDNKLSNNSSTVNPLDRQFDRLIINIRDLFIPYQPLLIGKTFVECDLIGPGVLMFDRCDLISPIMSACSHVVYNPEKKHPVMGAVGFSSSRFERCRFISITFLINPELAMILETSPGTRNNLQLLGYEFSSGSHLTLGTRAGRRR
jgi:hypothetical protein